MHYSNAGHNPFFIYDSKSDKVITIEKPGYAINLLPDSSYSLEKINLQKNDLIFVYTDGLNEAANDKYEMFGIDRIIEIMNQMKHESAFKIMNKVRTDLYDFASNTIPADDIAMIAIKIN